HNQYEAERAFGADFMSRKRYERQQRSMPQLAPGQVAEARALAKDHARDVWIGLRGLGCPAEEARRAAEFSQTLPGATLEERMRAALATLGPRSRSRRC
ncbi:MAG TPA: RuvA C-terminal domain-containing protein, partial [Candidatus Eisenbacteria bacterium]|nr:RuvA C-terminal domain-containing protein [Candidatus Eisenbacteria bacterium]